MAYKIKKLPTKKQAELYVKLRKKGLSVEFADDLMKKPSLAKRVLKFAKKQN